jgi:hypothetical protein
MAKHVGFNWRNDYINCSEADGCYYVNKKCFNPYHMTLKDYESHFKAKMTLRTMNRFKKAISHYLPGDNVIHSIIEQTRFMKKSETETVVKKWEENWMSGDWNEAITHADAILDKQEYQSLVKVMLHYVRLFVHSEAKYATQDYLKAVMIQEYVGEIFTEEHYKTLTKPWLEGKHLSEPHYWKYDNRHLNVDTQSLNGVIPSQIYDVESSFATVEKLFRNETEPDFMQEESFTDALNRSSSADVDEYAPTFWIEKMSKRETIINKIENEIVNETLDNVNVETQAMDFDEILLNKNDDNADLVVEEDKTPSWEHNDSFEEVKMGNKIIDNVSKPINRFAEYLGYSVGSANKQVESEKVDYSDFISQAFDSTEDKPIKPDYTDNVSNELAELVKQVMVEKQSSYVEEETITTPPVSTIEPTGDLDNVPEHLQEFIKTIYFK